jgi:hypothetical protein
MWYDKFAADAFVDAYGNIDWMYPKPQAFIPSNIPLRSYDIAQGFSLAWIGLNGSYTADPVGGTISLRFGPSAAVYNVSAATPPNPMSDNAIGMQNVRQAYATIKPADKFTIDVGKYDQPYGSEVPDAQLNMEYTRSILFGFMQPVFFTGVRLDYAPTDTIDAKLIIANGWNATFSNNRSKSYGAQFSIKPIDSLQLYLGYVGGPQQNDFAINAMGAITNVPEANSHWRHLVDFVADFNPTKTLRLLLNADYDTEDLPAGAGHSASWYGANLAIHYVAADPFALTLRGEFVSDAHGDVLPKGADATGNSTTMESITLTLSTLIGSHVALMFDNRIDVADSSIFPENTNGTFTKTQFTTTLGVIASTK